MIIVISLSNLLVISFGLVVSEVWEIAFFSAEQLKNEQVPNPSVIVEKATGTPSVAEAAALCLGKGKLIVTKQKHGDVTVAVGTVEGGLKV